MLLPAIEKLIGLTVLEIEDWAGQFKALSKAFNIVKGLGDPRGIYSRWVGLMRAEQPTWTRGDINEAYYAARYFANQGQYLANYDRQSQMDVSLAKVIYTPSGLGPRGEEYRYVVTVYMTYPGDSEPTPRKVYVASNDLLSSAEAIADGLAHLYGPWKPKSIPVEYGGEREGIIVSAAVTSFERFTGVKAA